MVVHTSHLGNHILIWVCTWHSFSSREYMLKHIYSVSPPKKNVYIEGHFFTGTTLVFGNLRYCLRLLVEKDPKLYINNWF